MQASHNMFESPWSNIEMSWLDDSVIPSCINAFTLPAPIAASLLAESNIGQLFMANHNAPVDMVSILAS